jgi:hypothetical protein
MSSVLSVLIDSFQSKLVRFISEATGAVSTSSFLQEYLHIHNRYGAGGYRRRETMIVEYLPTPPGPGPGARHFA